MRYDFLRQFPRRMKTVGLYTSLICNSTQKSIWKDYQFVTIPEQINMVFSVLLYIMEQSLKEEQCTVNDIAAFLDTVNALYFRKPMSFDDCVRLSDFIVNDVLSNGGISMSFDGYDFENCEMKSIPISYVANRIVYTEQEQRRTSYYLTDDGYSLLLGTLEMESNLKLTIQEMVFQLHLEKQSYDKALDDVKNIFSLMRIQLQKIQEAMRRIRRNALDYSHDDYERLLRENLETIETTKSKFQVYRETVRKRSAELRSSDVTEENLAPKTHEQLKNLRQIDHYLHCAIDEYQKILSSHFDLKSLYSDELEKFMEFSVVQRFSLRQALFDPLLADGTALDRLEIFLRPLLRYEMKKSYHLNMAFAPQNVRVSAEEEEATTEDLDFDEARWRAEQEQLRRKKLARYEGVLCELLKAAWGKESVTLSEIKQLCQEDDAVKERLIPSLDIFKEVMVELLKTDRIDINALRAEKADFLQEESEQFQLNQMLLNLIQQHSEWRNIQLIWTNRLPAEPPVMFKGVPTENGARKTVSCTELRLGLDIQDLQP